MAEYLDSLIKGEQKASEEDSTVEEKYRVFDLPYQEPPPFHAKYYEPFYILDIWGNVGCDQYVYYNPNTLCVFGICATHAALRPLEATVDGEQGSRAVPAGDSGAGGDERCPISKVEFVEEIQNMSVSGKRKRGGIWLKKKTIACRIHRRDGEIHTVFAGIPGTLFEINSRLAGEIGAELLWRRPEAEGYIGILKVNLASSKKETAECPLPIQPYSAHLVPVETYEAHKLKRMPSSG